MKIDNARFREHRWLVNAVAPDFELLDLWELDTGDTFDAFCDRVLATGFDIPSPIVRGLFGLRRILGAAFRWDRPEHGTTIVDRIGDDASRKSRVPPGTIVSTTFGARCLYRLEDEALVEIANATIHALIHLSLAPGGRPRIAILIRSRGLISRIYMAAIHPFRMLVVYPAWTRHLERAAAA
jgi:hypothetical protein